MEELAEESSDISISTLQVEKEKQESEAEVILNDEAPILPASLPTVVCDDTHVAKAVVKGKEVCLKGLPVALMQADLDTTVVLLKDVSYASLGVP